MVLVEPSAEVFQAFIDDPSHDDLHPLREDGTPTTISGWAYDKLRDVPLFQQDA